MEQLAALDSSRVPNGERLAHDELAIGDLRKDVKGVQAAYEAAQKAKDTALREKSDVLSAMQSAEERLTAAQGHAQQRVHETVTALKLCEDKLEEAQASRLSMQSRVGGLVKSRRPSKVASAQSVTPACEHVDVPLPHRQRQRHPLLNARGAPRRAGPTQELPTMTSELMGRPTIPRAAREAAERRVGSLDSFEMAAALGSKGMHTLVPSTRLTRATSRS